MHYPTLFLWYKTDFVLYRNGECTQCSVDCTTYVDTHWGLVYIHTYIKTSLSETWAIPLSPLYTLKWRKCSKWLTMEKYESKNISKMVPQYIYIGMHVHTYIHVSDWKWQCFYWCVCSRLIKWTCTYYHTMHLAKVAKWNIVSILGLRILHAINMTSQKRTDTSHNHTRCTHFYPSTPTLLGTNLNARIPPTY